MAAVDMVRGIDRMAKFKSRMLYVLASATIFHTQRKASPMFLLGAPPVRTVASCTMPATSFTNIIISSCRLSVVGVKSRMSQNPKQARTRLPGIIGSSWSSPLVRFCFRMPIPASPSATLRRRVILWRLTTICCISMMSPLAFPLDFCISSSKAASKGFAVSCLTNFRILLRGVMRRRSMSVPRTKLRPRVQRARKSVVSMLSHASRRRVITMEYHTSELPVSDVNLKISWRRN
mmetsp:Transcript_33449/g.56174  ORF Transcript_33449/g.56174 Transcript_33449/m.56174 type:complete len:234 (-) Transcript_33449:3510-4211(-)